MSGYGCLTYNNFVHGGEIELVLELELEREDERGKLDSAETRIFGTESIISGKKVS